MLDKLKKYGFNLCISFISALIGALGGYYYPHPVTTLKSDPTQSSEIVKEVVKYKTNTEYVYVPKVNGEKTDVEVKQEQPTVNVKVNDKSYDFKLDQYESQKFDKGKLVVNQSGEIKIDIQSKQDIRKWNMKLGKSNHGMAGGLDYQAGNIIGAWSYFDKKTTAGGISVKF